MHHKIAGLVLSSKSRDKKSRIPQEAEHKEQKERKQRCAYVQQGNQVSAMCANRRFALSGPTQLRETHEGSKPSGVKERPRILVPRW